MFKEYARRRMDAINAEIRDLIDCQDSMSNGQDKRLLKLDRDHKFWERWSA